MRDLAEENPQPAIWRQRGARAALDKARSISCVPHPNLTHGHMKNWRVQENIQTILSNVKQMKCVSPSSRTLETCASTASASTSYRKPKHCRTAPKTRPCTSRTIATADACGNPSRVREPDRKPKQRERYANGHDLTRRHLVFQKRKRPQWYQHPHTPKLLWNYCERARGPNVAFPSNLKWHSLAKSSDVQQRDVPHGPKSVTALASLIHVGLVDVLQKLRPVCRSNQHPQLTPSCPSHQPWRAHAKN